MSVVPMICPIQKALAKSARFACPLLLMVQGFQMFNQHLMGWCSSMQTLLGWVESQLCFWSLARLFPSPVSREQPWKGLCPCKDSSKLKNGIQCLGSGSSLASARKQSPIIVQSVSNMWKKARIRAGTGPRRVTSTEKAGNISWSSIVLTAGLHSFQNHNQEWLGLKWKWSQTAASHQKNLHLPAFHCCFQDILISPISFQIPQEWTVNQWVRRTRAFKNRGA